MYPSNSTVTPRPDIGLGFEEFDQEANQEGYIGLTLCPVAEAELAFGQYEVIKAEEDTREVDDTRNPDGSYQEVDGNFEFRPYSTKEHGLESRVDDNQANVFSRVVSQEIRAAKRVRTMMKERHEQRVIDLLNAKTAAHTYTGNEFDDPTFDLAGLFVDLIYQFRIQCGAEPTHFTADTDVINRMLLNGSIQDKYVGSADRTGKAIADTGLAAALNLKGIVRANSVRNTATAPKAKSFATMFPRTLGVLSISSDEADTVPVQWAKTIHWSGDGSKIGGAFETYYSAKRRGTMVRSRSQYKVHELYPDAIMTLDGIITPS